MGDGEVDPGTRERERESGGWRGDYATSELTNLSIQP